MILVRFYYLEGVCHLNHQVLEHSPDVTRKISKRVRSMLKSELLLQTSNFLETKMVYSSLCTYTIDYVEGQGSSVT